MLTRKKTALIYILTSLLVVSCTSDDITTPSTVAGHINLKVQTDNSVAEAVSRTTTADLSLLESITADKLTISMTNESGSSAASWPTYYEFPSEKEFPAGSYTMTASYGNEEAEGYDLPRLFGQTSFTVSGGKVSSVQVTAKVSNSLVSFEPTDEFVKYFKSVKIILTTNTHTIVAEPNETRPVYINPGNATVGAHVTMPSGNEGTITIGKFTAKQGTLHRIGLDVDATTGSAVLTVTFDDNLAEEQITIDLNEDIFSAPVPVITPQGFTAGEPIDIVIGNKAPERQQFNLISRGGLSEASLFISVDGNETEYNLLDSETLATLSSSGVKAIGFDNTQSETIAKVDVTEYVTSLSITKKTEVNYRFEAKDKLNRQAEVAEGKTNSLTVNVHPEEVAIRHIGAKAIILPEIKIEYDEADIWAKKATVSVATVDQDDMDLLTEKLDNLTLTINDNNVAVSNSTQFDFADLTPGTTYNITGTLSVPTFKVKVNTNMDDVDNGRLVLKLGSDQEDITLPFKILSAEKQSDDSYVYILEVNTPEGIPTYDFSAVTKYECMSNQLSITTSTVATGTFTTEDALQLPNANMEDWYTTDDVHTQTQGFLITVGKTDIKRWHPNLSNERFWATRNALTTGQKSGTTYYYTSYSGTIPVNWNNSQAAEISTLGFGEDSPSPGTNGQVGNPKKKAAGMLFTGEHSSDGDTEEFSFGQPFNSRPTSISFDYKYVPVNSESFTAYIVLENRDNEVITELGRGEYSSDKNVPFENLSIEINYTNTDLKATHVYVVFESSTSDNPQVLSVRGRDSSIYNYGDSKYIGSVLTIDNIILNY